MLTIKVYKKENNQKNLYDTYRHITRIHYYDLIKQDYVDITSDEIPIHNFNRIDSDLTLYSEQDQTNYLIRKRLVDELVVTIEK